MFELYYYYSVSRLCLTKFPTMSLPFSLIDIAINYIPTLDKVVGTTVKVDTHPPGSISADGDPHQDGALDAEGSGGELTAKWRPWRGCLHGNNLPGGRYCGLCGDSACRNHICQMGYCRDCRHDNQCPSGRMCDAVSANYVSVSILLISSFQMYAHLQDLTEEILYF